MNGKLSEIETKNKNMKNLCKDIRNRKGYQARVNVIQNETEELLADSNAIHNRRKDYFSQLCLLNVHKENVVGES